MITKNFSKKEMSCPCCNRADMSLGFMMKLQKVRDIVDVPLTITSGYRCAKHNKSVGGAPSSYHLLGQAADIAIKGDKQLRYKIVKAAMEVGMGGIECSSKHIHMDSRDLSSAIFILLDKSWKPY